MRSVAMPCMPTKQNIIDVTSDISRRIRQRFGLEEQDFNNDIASCETFEKCDDVVVRCNERRNAKMQQRSLKQKQESDSVMFILFDDDL